MFVFLGMAMGAVQASYVLVAPERSPASEMMERAAAAIVLRDEAQIRSLLSSRVIYDPDFKASGALRGLDSEALERVIREIRPCELRGVFRSDATIPTYTINWACHYRMEGTGRIAYDGAGAVLRWVDGKPTLANFSFQGPWAPALRTPN